MNVLQVAVIGVALLALGACKDNTEVQAEIKKGNPEGQQLRKKYEEAGKQADERRKAE